VENDPIEDAAHPSGAHPTPANDTPTTPPDQGSGEGDIVDGRNPTQQKIDAEKDEAESRPERT
jgi:hypothetical protein